MQALWSRAAQAQSCGCRSCLTATTTISRRATTASPRRSLKAGDLFTACYTAMFATAALADLKFKDDRRKRWDVAIEEARTGGHENHDVGSSPINQADAERPKEDFTDAALSLCQQAIALGGLNNPHSYGSGPFVIEVDSLEAQLDAARKNQAPAWMSVRDHLEADSFRDRSPRSRVHLDHMEGMVARLVTRLLAGVERTANVMSSKVTSYSASHENVNARSAEREVTEGYNHILPTYAVLPLDTMRAEHAFLNRSLMEVFRSRNNGDTSLRSAVGKLCHNLLVSSTPPNADTYSLMIQQFTRLGQHHLAEVVVDSFLKESRLKPRTETVAVILRHYVAAGDKTGFEKIISRMKGLNGDFRIKRRTKHDLRYRDVCEWASTTKVTYRNGLITQKVTRDAQIFETLIDGFLEFSRLNRAIRYLRAAFREGCHISFETLRRLTQACLDSLDIKAAVKLLAALSAHWGESVISNMRGHEQHIRHDVYRLLHFCGVPLKGTLSLPRVPKGVNQKSLDYMVEDLSFRISGLPGERDWIGEMSSVLARSGAQLQARQEQVIECFLAKFSPADKRLFAQQMSPQPRDNLSTVLQISRKNASTGGLEDKPVSEILQPASDAPAVDVMRPELLSPVDILTPRKTSNEASLLPPLPHLTQLQTAFARQQSVEVASEARDVSAQRIQLWRVLYLKDSASKGLAMDNPYRVYDAPDESQLGLTLA